MAKPQGSFPQGLFQNRQVTVLDGSDPIAGTQARTLPRTIEPGATQDQPALSARRLDLGPKPALDLEPALGPDQEVDPLYPVALLKIAMAMKRLPPQDGLHFDRILDDVLADLALDRERFGGYLEKHKGRLMAAVKTRGY